MQTDNPKAWFTNSVAKISYRSVDKWAEQSRQYRPYFSTWKQAHDWMLDKAEERLKRAKSELVSARRALEKNKTMQDPASLHPIKEGDHG